MPGIDSSPGGVSYASGDQYYDYVLNDLLLPVVTDVVIYPNAWLKRMQRTSDRIDHEGKLVRHPVHTDDANGVSALGEDGRLPEADTEKFAQYAYGLRFLYVRAKFTGIAAEASKTRIASWLGAVETEMEAKAKILARQRQRMYCAGDGSGILAEVTAWSSPTATVRINQNIESPGTCLSAPTRFLKVGQLVVFVTPGTGTITAVAKIATIPNTTQFTVVTSGAYNLSGTPLVGDVVCTIGQFNAVGTAAIADTGFKNEPMGLAGILSDADPPDGTAVGFQGIASASNAWHRANLLTNGGVARPLTLELVDEAFLKSVEIGDVVPTVILGDFKQVRKYAQLLLPDRRYPTSGGTMNMDGGYGLLSYNSVPFMADRDMWGERLALLYEPDFRMHVMADPGWMDMDGRIYQRLADKHAYQATLYAFETMGVDRRHTQTLITDLD
jgi:hypothetical protein